VLNYLSIFYEYPDKYLLSDDLPAATLALLSDTVGKFIAFDSTNYRNIFRYPENF